LFQKLNAEPTSEGFIARLAFAKTIGNQTHPNQDNGNPKHARDAKHSRLHTGDYP